MLKISWYILTFSISLHKIQLRAYWNSEQKTYCLVKHENAQEQQEFSNF